MKRIMEQISITYLILVFAFTFRCTDQKIEDLNNSYQKPAWLKEELVIGGGNQEPLIFRIRRGTGVTIETEDYYYNKEHNEERVKEAKDFGGTLWITHLFKGFGIEAEKEELKYAKKLAELIHQHGMKVGTYVGSTIGYETFLLEKPEARDWLIPDYLGAPVTYGGEQYFRRRPYFAHPEYIKYMKEIIRIGIKEVKTDLFHFDNPANLAVPEVFHHPLAIEQFRDFLRKKYSPEILKKRLGFSNVSLVVPPKYSSPESMETFDDPITQEWIDFRCQKLSDYYREMANYIRKLDPNVAVEINPHGITGVNRAWESSVDFPRLLAHTDVFWMEDGNNSTVTENGILISNIRSYKMGRTLHNLVFNGNNTPVLVTEAMAFNQVCLGSPGKAQRKYVKFFHDNFEHYRETDNIADVAILRSFPSMAYNNYTTHQSTILFEQVLIQAKIPFDIIFDDNLKDLSKYSVLVLANQESLSDDQLDLIRNYVRQGGGLVATEYSSLYNEWRRSRISFGLKDLFNVERPLNVERLQINPEQPLNVERPQRNVSEAIKSEPVRNQFGDGRVVYIPAIVPSIERPPTAPMRNRYWKLPLNWMELVESVKWAAGDELSIEVNAPLTVTIELTEKLNGNSLMLHLVNYDVTRNSLVKNVGVSLKLSDGKKVKQLSMLSPDEENSQSLDFSIINGRVVFTIPRLETYGLVVIELY